MSKTAFLIAFVLSGFWAFAQEDAWVYFKDKPNAQFYLENPLEMLSQRSIDRRTNQGIALDVQDVPVHQEYIDQISNQASLQIIAKSRWLNALHIRGSQSAVNSLLSLSFVERVDFADNALDNQSIRPKIAFTKKKPEKSVRTERVQANFSYGISGNQIQMLNGHLLHQQDYTGLGKIIAVLDAGFPGVNTAQPFERLRNNNQILGGYNFVDRNEDFYSRGSHGTLVLSTMGGFRENQLVGTAPDASYYLFITEDVGSENPVEESYWVEAAETADSLGVDVINTSLGYFGYDNPNYSYTYADIDGNTSFIARAANVAFSRGMVVVVSAGNSGASANPNIGTPADAENVLSIGAVDANEGFVAFSSVGPTADERIKPDVVAQGFQAVVSGVNGDITTASGTSFSGPIIAGMVASLWQALPWATNAQIVEFIKQSSDQAEFPDSERGYGVPDFQLALSIAQLSVKEENKRQFLLYPNPFDDRINVSFPVNSANADMILYNSLGQTILSQKITSENTLITLENLASGLYFYKIISQGNNQSGKIVKQ